MSKFEEINNNLKDAMRVKNELELSTLRMIIATIKNKKIELKQGDDLNDEQIVAVIKTEIKKRKDSILAYEQGSRPDLADKEKKEIEILTKYVPEQMSEEEIKKIAREIISSGEFSANDLGKAMGAVMGKLKGQADGGAINAIVKKILSE
ncbi:MAG: GatB/YqeY domain-containing protein [bacterium]